MAGFGMVDCGRCGKSIPAESNGDRAQMADIPGKGVTTVCLECIEDLKLEAAAKGQTLVSE